MGALAAPLAAQTPDTLRITASDRPLWGQVTLDTVVMIGEVEGPDEYIFGEMGDVHLQGDRIYIADPFLPTVRVFDLEGRFLRQIGRQGSGPGEYTNPAGLLPPLGDDYRLDANAWPMHGTRMATKTISLRLDAYERLRRARLTPDESFTEVVLRAQWPDRGLTARELRAVYQAEGPFFDAETLDRIDEAKRLDRPPEDKWTER